MIPKDNRKSKTFFSSPFLVFVISSSSSTITVPSTSTRLTNLLHPVVDGHPRILTERDQLVQ